MKPYAVVTFINDSTIDLQSSSEVPACWLENLNQCWWPNTKNVGPLIVKKVMPDKTNSKKWQMHDVQFEGFYGKFSNNYITKF